MTHILTELTKVHHLFIGCALVPISKFLFPTKKNFSGHYWETKFLNLIHAVNLFKNSSKLTRVYIFGLKHFNIVVHQWCQSTDKLWFVITSVTHRKSLLSVYKMSPEPEVPQADIFSYLQDQPEDNSSLIEMKHVPIYWIS